MVLICFYNSKGLFTPEHEGSDNSLSLGKTPTSLKHSSQKDFSSLLICGLILHLHGGNIQKKQT